MQLVGPVVSFNSLEGCEYIVQKYKGTTMVFKRQSTKEIWDMDLKQVHKAYLELKDFKTINFKEYVYKRHSPALGLLLHLKLLVDELRKII
ncbi:hypothetical protein SAMN04488513_11438 [Pseudozobellia thermophila]|uniref:Uncharacterized protein n=2 Tax=Pseudozobellia thermophila TaxID=192903 RepID=A0A1M6NNE5_9FLAO|nr:hypothetical protein SAMN04488513_11438 [Pseudozobellia thermophila]